jgi:hypothetical protein
MKLTVEHIEIAVYNYFCFYSSPYPGEQIFVVPNIYKAIPENREEKKYYEKDLLAVSITTGRCAEVEIKTSLSDLSGEKDKKHDHKSTYADMLFFAMPIKLAMDIKNVRKYIPQHAGILAINDDLTVKEVYSPTPIFPAMAKPLTSTDILDILKLANRKFWRYKEKTILWR